MALDIAPPNFSGTAAIAGRGISNIDLESPGALGLQALQIVQQQWAAKKKAEMERAQLMQQAQQALAQQGTERARLGLLAQQGKDELNLKNKELTQRGLLSQFDQEYKNRELAQRGQLSQDDLALKSQDLAQRGQMNQDDLAFKYKDLDQRNQMNQEDNFMKQQQIALGYEKNSLTKLLAEKKETLKEKNAFASYSRLALESAKTPEEANMVTNMFLKEAVSKNYISQEEADQFAKLPINQRKNLLAYQEMKTGNVLSHKGLTEEKEKSGTNLEIAPDGTIKYSQAATNKNTDQIQKDLISNNDNLNELKGIVDNIPDNFFGAAAGKQSVNFLREWGQSIPGIGPLVEPSDNDKSQYKAYSKIQGKVKNLAMNVIRQQSGLSYTDSQLDFMNDVLPQVGVKTTKSEFKGRADNLMEYFNYIQQAKEDLLKEGVQLGSKEYEQKMLTKLKDGVQKVKEEKTSQSSGLRKHLESTGKYSKEEIDAYMKGKE